MGSWLQVVQIRLADSYEMLWIPAMSALDSTGSGRAMKYAYRSFRFL